MSDNEDLLADDLGDQSLADYNLGNEEEDQLLADDYEGGPSQNVPISSENFVETVQPPAPEYPTIEMQHLQQFGNKRVYHMTPDTGECVVPNITVEVRNPPERATYAPYEPPAYNEHAVPMAIPAAPAESPQIVPSEMATVPNDGNGSRDRFPSERPIGAQRTPQVRDIPDSLDKVIVPRGGFGGRGRSSWRNPHFQRFHATPYRRNNVQRGNFNQRPTFPPPQNLRSNSPQIRPELRPNTPQIRPEIRPELPPIGQPDLPPPPLRPELPNIPKIRPNLPPELRPDLPPLRPEFRPDLPPEMPEPLMPNIPIEPPFRPLDPRPPFRYPNQFRPGLDEPRYPRPNFEPFYQRPFRPYPPIREMAPNPMPQGPLRPGLPTKQEVRMLPVQLPPNLPPGGLQGKKVLINPHFKGNFQPPVEGPVKDIDDAAERFIAEQRNALARAAQRKFPPPRRSPQRFIENNTIEIENELARAPPRRSDDDDDLLRRQEEFINANRAGLRRRMRSPSPPPLRRSVSPRRSRSRSRSRSPDRSRIRVDSQRPQPTDEESEYRRRMREQEALRERVMRAKEARRRRNATAAIDRERERLEKEPPPRERETKDPPKEIKEKEIRDTNETITKDIKEPEPTSTQPDTTRKSPEREKNSKMAKVEREKTPAVEEAEVNSTCEALTPPCRSPSPSTPPLVARGAAAAGGDTDDDLDLILGDIDGILSDDDDTGRFKDTTTSSKSEPAKPAVDLRNKLPPKSSEKKSHRQKIVFHEAEKVEKKRKEKSPPRKTMVTSSTKSDGVAEKKLPVKTKDKAETSKDKNRMRQRITFESKEAEKEKEREKQREKLKQLEREEQQKPQFSNRRVVLQRKVAQNAETKSVFARIEVSSAKSDPTKPNPGIFSRAVRTAIGAEKSRIVLNKKDEPQIEYESDSDLDEDKLLEDVGNTALVSNLPHGMTDTRLKTLAGNDVQSLNLDKEDRSAKITFKTTIAAENFKKKFNNKMVAASRLSVILR